MSLTKVEKLTLAEHFLFAQLMDWLWVLLPVCLKLMSNSSSSWQSCSTRFRQYCHSYVHDFFCFTWEGNCIPAILYCIPVFCGVLIIVVLYLGASSIWIHIFFDPRSKFMLFGVDVFSQFFPMMILYFTG